jgi:predicted glycogen debranching enzyme
MTNREKKQPREVRVVYRRGDDAEGLVSREWLVTNGLGGYASGTLGGAATRRFHGPLVAVFPAPLARTLMVSHLAETARFGEPRPGSRVYRMTGDDLAGQPVENPDLDFLSEVRVEDGLPVWCYESEGAVLEKRVVVPHAQNTTHVTYSLLSGQTAVHLRVRPSLRVRAHEGPVEGKMTEPYPARVTGTRAEIEAPGFPPLRLRICGHPAKLALAEPEFVERRYAIEQSRGYDYEGDLFTPGYYYFTLEPGESATLIVSTESWDTLNSMLPDEIIKAEGQRRQRLRGAAPEIVRTGFGVELVFAADQFVIRPESRAVDEARAHAAGDETRTVIAGYPWFTDWGRDTMISLEGLTLATGRHTESGYILRTFARYVKDGLIPNMFPEGNSEGLYHTADATLWFFHALHRYLCITEDHLTLQNLLPVLIDIIDHHVKGTRFGIGVDPSDGLLKQGAPGYQLTWMDAKVGDWVVTPRRGKAVEINALFYNALKLLEGWVREERGDEEAKRYTDLAQRCRESFNHRFWNAEGKCLYDVVDVLDGPLAGKNDPAFRPNQVFAVSLDHPVLDREHWEPMLTRVRERLFTPVGLRSLEPGDPDYKPKYDGDLRARDAAYHQGTVWAWLIGPFVDAWTKTWPDDRDSVRTFLAGFEAHLGEACVGTISEVFDAEAPFTPRGCNAQAWSVAEVLRLLASGQGRAARRTTDEK